MGVVKFFSSGSTSKSRGIVHFSKGETTTIKCDCKKKSKFDVLINKFKITRIKSENGYVLAKINYPNCTNYKGDKIILFKNMNGTKLKNKKIIDPHFLPKNNILARFEPTILGWKLGMHLLKQLK